MIWLSAIVTVLALLMAGGVLLADSYGALDQLGEDAADLRDLATALMLLPLAPLAFYIYRFFMAAQARSNAVLVGPQQFPELYALYQDIASRLKMSRLPKLYVANGNGVVNAFALECNRRHGYVIIHAEIAQVLDQSPDVVSFVLAHELAHHKLRHVSLWRIVISLVPNLLVVLGVTTTRAQEYSADRLAMAVCPDHANALRLLSVGPWMEKGVNPQAWLEQANAEHREFFVRITNLLSSHAVGVKRFKALKDIETHGFSRHGEMF